MLIINNTIESIMLYNISHNLVINRILVKLSFTFLLTHKDVNMSNNISIFARICKKQINN